MVNVAWLSKHNMRNYCKNDLKKKIKKIFNDEMKMIQFKERFSRVKEIVNIVIENNIDVVCVVLPVQMQAELLKEMKKINKRVWLMKNFDNPKLFEWLELVKFDYKQVKI